jgi:hypothetical protein
MRARGRDAPEPAPARARSASVTPVAADAADVVLVDAAAIHATLRVGRRRRLLAGWASAVLTVGAVGWAAADELGEHRGEVLQDYRTHSQVGNTLRDWSEVLMRGSVSYGTSRRGRRCRASTACFRRTRAARVPSARTVVEMSGVASPARSPWRAATAAWAVTGALALFTLAAMLSIGVFLLIPTCLVGWWTARRFGAVGAALGLPVAAALTVLLLMAAGSGGAGCGASGSGSAAPGSPEVVVCG